MLQREPSEQGQITVAAVILWPILILAIWAVIQTSIAWFAHGNMEAAAADALSTYQLSTAGVSAGDPATVATATVQRHAKFVSDIVVVGPVPTSRADRVSFTVTGKVSGPFPGTTFNLKAVATGPTAVFRRQGELTP